MFSILIANYNNGILFKDCWESIIKQTVQDFEVVIVDDASSDNSLQIIKEIVQNDPRVLISINDKNYGCGYTKRRCAELAQGTICAFLDPDDAIVENALEVMVEAHKNNPEASVVSSKYYFVDMQMHIKSEGLNGQLIPEGNSYLTFGKGAITHFASFKTHFYNKTDGINPNLRRAVDQDLYYKLEETGPPIFIDKILYYYRVQERSISMNNNAFKAEYWHYFLKKETYFRRKKNPTQAINFTEKEFVIEEQNYFINRIKYEASQKNWFKKYYFVLLAFSKGFTPHFKHKVKCLLMFKYS
jgi:glycosyltransferase involved in cell wall biosynthesis